MKQDLIDKTVSLIERRGVEAVSMRDIAKRMGFSTMATYRHFSGKDELLLEAASRGFQLLSQEGDAAAGKESGPRKKLEAVLLAYYRFGQRHKNLLELMFGPIKRKEKLSENYQRSARESFLKFAAYVRGFACGEIEKESFEHQTAARLWAFIHGTTVLAANGFLSALYSTPEEMERRVKVQISEALDRSAAGL